MMATAEGSDCAALETVGVGAEEGIAPKKNGVSSCGQIEVRLDPTHTELLPYLVLFNCARKAARRACGGATGVVSRLRVLRCMAASNAAQLKSAREDIKEILKTTYCHPILVRLGWHDSGTYDKNIEEWPQRGGADGSLRFDPELSHGANAGITYADLFQLASATAIEEADGPKLSMKYGRVDITTPEQCPPEGRLPGILEPIKAGIRDAKLGVGKQEHCENWYLIVNCESDELLCYVNLGDVLCDVI
ncbi:thylakoid-bound ascorbate peroxidase [Hordeum vulgare]|nr:thylakoid-bound ascorbate peroxidase [Hordeum vulgare]